MARFAESSRAKSSGYPPPRRRAWASGGFVLQGAKGDELRPQGLQELQGLGVVEAEGLVPGVGHPDPWGAPFRQERGGLGQGGSGLGQAQDPLQVHPEGLAQGGQGWARLPGEHQTQMALRDFQGGILGKPTQKGQAHLGQRLLEKGRMPLRTHPVGEDPHHLDPRVKAPEALHQGRDGSSHAGGIHHQGHGGLEEPGHLGGGAHPAKGVLAVKQAHHPLHQGQVRPSGPVLEEGEEALVVPETTIQVVDPCLLYTSPLS